MHDAHPDREETAVEVLADFARRMSAVFARTGQKTVKRRVAYGPCKFLVTGGLGDDPDAATDDAVPETVAAMTGLTQRVYRALRDLRAELGGGTRIGPKLIRERICAEDDDEHAISKRTVARAVEELKGQEEIWQHGDFGLYLRGQQLALPF